MSTSPRAQAFIDSWVERLTPLECEQAEVSWRFALGDGPTADDVANAVSELRRYYGQPEALATINDLLTQGGLSDAQRRQLEIVQHACAANQMSPEAQESLSRLEAKVEDRFNHFRASLGGEAVSDNDLRAVLLSGDDVGQRQAAWEASKAIGSEVEGDVRQLVRMRNHEAQALGYRDFYSMSLAHQELDEPWLTKTLEDLEARTRAPFFAVKSRLDDTLRQRFNLSSGATLAPWHYADPFFQMRPPQGDSHKLDALFDGVDNVELSRRFFAAIGMPVEDILDASDLFERDGKNQHAFCTRLNRQGDVRILTNLRQDEGWTATLLHELGHAVYDKGLPMSLPYLLRDVSHSLTTEAVALMIERMTHHGPWLREWLGISDAEATALGRSAARATSEGQLIFTRWGLVMTSFERAMYADPEQDLNALWWRLVEQLQGIAMPEGRQGADWAAKIHTANVPVYYQNYLLGEVVASQFWNHLLTDVVGDAPDPQAALAVDPRVGRFFKESVFSPGASNMWLTHVEQATGQALDSGHHTRLMESAQAG